MKTFNATITKKKNSDHIYYEAKCVESPILIGTGPTIESALKELNENINSYVTCSREEIKKAENFFNKAMEVNKHD